MQSVDDITNEILRREGGFVNDPDDPGGATNFGVTIGTLSAIRGRNVSVQDVQNLTRQEAFDIFKEYYYRRPRIASLPDPIEATVFDMNVNAGSNSIKILQRLMIAFGWTVSVDGVLGPQSIGVAEEVHNAAGRYFVDAYGIARRNYYFAIADRRPKSRKYARSRDGRKGGWIKRAEEFLSPRYHMTDEQFAERTSKWA